LDVQIVNRLKKALALALLASLLSIALEAVQRQVMDSTLPAGTIRRLDPGHPTLSGVVTTHVGDTFTITWTLDAPQAAFALGTPEYQLCQSRGARCAQFEVTLPSGMAWLGRRRLAIREQGQTDWKALTNTRSVFAAGVFVDEYEEFHGFSIGPIFATVNCDIIGREKTSWAVRLWTQRTVSFRIDLELKRC
jgi:hypothetical protein